MMCRDPKHVRDEIDPTTDFVDADVDGENQRAHLWHPRAVNDQRHAFASSPHARPRCKVIGFKSKQRGSTMANDLTELTPHINEMRTKLSQTAEHERSLAQALSDELKRMDQETLRNVRNMSAEHEARRAGILIELQALAASMCTFQRALQQQAAPKLNCHDELEASLQALRS